MPVQPSIRSAAAGHVADLEVQLACREAELESVRTDLTRFAHAASHELQQWLRTVASSLQFVQMRYRHQLDARAHELLGYAVFGAKRIQTLIESLGAAADAASAVHGPRAMRAGNDAIFGDPS